MTQNRFALLVMGAVMISLCSISSADVPHMINYQGKLTTADGGCVNDTVQMTFTIYADSLGTTSEWTETQIQVVVNEGVFSVLLGAVDSVPTAVFDGSIKYLGIQVESDPEMRPLRPVVSVAYAYKSSVADTADYARAATASDKDWTFHVTDGGDTTLITGGRWGIARYGSVLLGDADSTHVNLGIACTTGTSASDYKYCTVGGGEGNAASHYHATVGGGHQNTASSWRATVGGGAGNRADHDGATVGGGMDNAACGGQATVGGGWHNIAGNFNATVAGGISNTATGYSATVSGGAGNVASGGQFATVPGGYLNTATGYYSLAAGYSSTASGYCSYALGRSVTLNASAEYSFGFGNSFTSSTPHAVIFYDASSDMKVGIQTTDPQGALDVNSTTGALIVPRMTAAQRNALTPVNGMIIYNTTDNQFNFYENGTWVTK